LLRLVFDTAALRPVCTALILMPIPKTSHNYH